MLSSASITREGEGKLVSTLNINLKASNLLDKDVVGHSDSFAIMYVDFRVPSAAVVSGGAGGPAPPPEKPGAPRDSRWERIGLTETCANECNPRWAKSFQVPYFFERAQRIALDVYDRDSIQDWPLSLHDFLGSAHCSMPTLVRAKGQKLELSLKKEDRPDQNCGTITLVAEEEEAFRTMVCLSIEAGNLKTGFSWRSEHPSLTISRLSAGSYKDAMRHEAIDGDTKGSPSIWELSSPGSGERIVVHGPIPARRIGDGWWAFDYMTINFQRLCFGNKELPLYIDLTGKKGALIGSACINLADWVASPILTLHNRSQDQSKATSQIPKTSRTLLSRRKKGKETGTVVLKESTKGPNFTFLDYVGGGYEISLVLALDYTASNGNPSDPGSLHFIDQTAPNEYERAIQTVGEILAPYDSDQLFPAYGFGAKLPPQYRKTSHCFSLTGTDDPRCSGIDGVLEAYRQTLYNVRLFGPTEFAEIIRAAIGHVTVDMQEGAQSYTIMLILTDGVINDLQNTVDEIVRAAFLPMSIVIVGVGGEDFTGGDMDKLDGDDERLCSSTGEPAARDIVQFVPFRKYLAAPEVLAAKVLEEIPGQFLQYTTMHNIQPPDYVEVDD